MEPSQGEPSAEGPRSHHKRPAREVVEAALVKAKRVQGEAARLLGVHERRLARWMDVYGTARAKKSRSGM